MMRKVIMIGMTLVLLPFVTAMAGITYDAATNSINVAEFPDEDQPATLAMVYQADRSNGWNKITYDQAANTYRLDANLVIGTEKTEGTYFQIGSAGPLPETLVIKGSIWVRPPAESMKRPDGAFSIMNRLCLGNPTNDAVKAALKFEVKPPQRYGLCVGSGNARRGTLYLLNSTLGVLNPGTGSWFAIFYKNPVDEKAGRYTAGWYASELRIVNSTIADSRGWSVTIPTGRMKQFARRRVASTLEYFEPLPTCQIENSVFENNDSVFYVMEGGTYVKRCVFKNNQVVFQGVTRAVECVLTNNQCNWKLSGEAFHVGMLFLDCDLQPQKRPVALMKNKNPSAYRHATMHIPEYPQVKYYRSLLVKVVDAAGQPVPGAMVTVMNEEFPKNIWRGAALTDAAGLTGQDAEKNAIQVIERLFTATEQPEQPKVQTFAYKVKAEKGQTTKTVLIDTQNPIPKPLVVKLD